MTCRLLRNTAVTSVDEFPVPQADRKSKQVKNTVTQKILFAISMGKKLPILDT